MEGFSGMALSLAQATVQGREIITKRMFDAPREWVYLTWTDSKHLQQWWGPKGFTITTHEFNAKPGGVWRYTMHGPDGADYANKITYIETVRPERLVYSHGDDEQEESFRVTVQFADRGGKTALTMRSMFRSEEELAYAVREFGAAEGAKSTMECLAEYLASIE